MKDAALIEKVHETMMDYFYDSRNNMPRVIIDGMIRHNVQVRKYVIELSEGAKDTVPLELSALLHNIWRAVPHPKTGPAIRDEAYDKKSAEEAERILKKLKAPAATIKKVKTLIENQSKAKTKEQKVLLEADSISFLENTLPIWFESGLWLGQNSKELIEMAKKKVEAEYGKIKSEKGKKIAKRFYDKWLGWLEQKEL